MEGPTPALLAFILAGLVQLILAIFFIAKLWLNGNAAHERIDDIEAESEKDLSGLKIEIKELKVDFYKHVADVKAHHNEEAVKEFRDALERRFSGMETSLADISRKLNHLAGRE